VPDILGDSDCSAPKDEIYNYFTNDNGNEDCYRWIVQKDALEDNAPDPAELERVVRTHAFAAHHLCQLVLPSMKTRPRGDIVMISSVATLHHGAGGAPYNMGKAALEALAFTLAKEVRHHGVRVNVVAPGLVETEMGRRLMKATAGVTDLRSLDAVMPFGRVCQPEDVANVVRFLVSEGAGYLTGEKLNVYGGGQQTRQS
jgi:NAD(P)-dependent dehydrogenase (short-subunit alcohol dehydrogenase family)